MNWRFKANIQRAIAALPPAVADPVYGWLIARFGLTRDPDPIVQIVVAKELLALWERAGGSPAGARFLEIGTGWRISIPLALWLRGARSVTCVDIKSLLDERTVRSDLAYVREHPDAVVRALDGRVDDDRLRELIEFADRAWRLDDLFRLCAFDYHAPCDAAHLSFDTGSFDCQISYATLEHIPPEWLRAVHVEARRVLRGGGVGLHRIDLSDHFYRTDRSISPLNFLQFDQRTWAAIGGNRYVYTNRLRIDDYLRLFEECGFRVVACERYSNPRGLEQLRDPSFRVDESFRGKSEADLAVTSAWALVQKPRA